MSIKPDVWSADALEALRSRLAPALADSCEYTATENDAAAQQATAEAAVLILLCQKGFYYSYNQLYRLHVCFRRQMVFVLYAAF